MGFQLLKRRQNKTKLSDDSSAKVDIGDFDKFSVRLVFRSGAFYLSQDVLPFYPGDCCDSGQNHSEHFIVTLECLQLSSRQ